MKETQLVVLRGTSGRMLLCIQTVQQKQHISSCLKNFGWIYAGNEDFIWREENYM